MNGREQPQAAKERAKPRSTGEVAAQSSLIGQPNDLSRSSSQSANNRHHSVELHIEELVLHGFDSAHRYLISGIIERELTRLFIERGVNDAIAQPWETARLDGGVFEVQPGSGSEVIGTQLARAIYGGLSR